MLAGRYGKLSLVLLIVGLASVQSVSADQVTISGPSVTKDTYVQGSTGIGDPGNAAMVIGYWSYNYTPNRALIVFNLSSVPSDVAITSATLKLYHVGNVGIAGEIPGSHINTTNYYRLKVPWDVGAATWFWREYGEAWNDFNPLNDGVTAEMEPTATTDVAIGLDAPVGYWVDADVTTDVQYLQANPSLNYGWLIIGNEADTHTVEETVFGRAWRATSSEGDPQFRPQLVVDYTPVNGSVAGKVTLGDFVGSDDGLASVAVRVDLIQNGSIVRTERLLLDAAGNYTINGVPEGVYAVAFKASSWLRQAKTNVSVTAGQSTQCDIILTGGDANGDNEITGSDLSAVLQNMDVKGD